MIGEKKDLFPNNLLKDKERPMERGRNVTLHIYFVRHGEKEFSYENPDTPLTPRGEKDGRDFGKRLESRKAIKHYSSVTNRTKDTAKVIVDGSPTQKKMKLRERHNLAFCYDPNGKFFEDFKKFKAEILGPDYEDLSEPEKIKRSHAYEAALADHYLSFKDKRPDPNTYSPVETAATMADSLRTFSGMARRIDSDSEIDLINSTHDFNLASFLNEVIIRDTENGNVRGFNSIKDIGGPIDFNEHIEMIIHLDKTGQQSTRLIFRDQEYTIDEKRLNELFAVADKLKKEKQMYE